MAVYTCPMPFHKGRNYSTDKAHDESRKMFWFLVLFSGVYTGLKDAEARMDERLRGRDLFIFKRVACAEERWALHCISDHRHDQRAEIGPDRHIPTPPPSQSGDDDEVSIDNSGLPSYSASSSAAPPSLFVLRSSSGQKTSIFKGSWQEAAAAAEPGERVSRLAAGELEDGSFFG
ncbi:hypothetical protein FB45DRAFT_1021777 [Roridomyces roridus]|uniref:Uncharacterized protein n=1 Tax=Roridomyces roridus TaxID=1738132 RepID=A0AAD7C6N8_9AGAR|nr:hypothetical protein FB45DRAFT_1037936 [Roridomyces roridus]KAJ7640994.1 hypothetical protein FB45DRAFT_1021777 [Roridomyces roridus]